jgi:hypothetical protein
MALEKDCSGNRAKLFLPSKISSFALKGWAAMFLVIRCLKHKERQGTNARASAFRSSLGTRKLGENG